MVTTPFAAIFAYAALATNPDILAPAKLVIQDGFAYDPVVTTPFATVPDIVFVTAKDVKFPIFAVKLLVTEILATVVFPVILVFPYTANSIVDNPESLILALCLSEVVPPVKNTISFPLVAVPTTKSPSDTYKYPSFGPVIE